MFSFCPVDSFTLGSLESAQWFQSEAQKIGEYDYRIWIDRRENTSIADVRDTLQREACRVSVDWKEQEAHGPMFQECMTQFR